MMLSLEFDINEKLSFSRVFLFYSKKKGENVSICSCVERMAIAIICCWLFILLVCATIGFIEASTRRHHILHLSLSWIYRNAKFSFQTVHARRDVRYEFIHLMMEDRMNNFRARLIHKIERISFYETARRVVIVNEQNIQ